MNKKKKKISHKSLLFFFAKFHKMQTTKLHTSIQELLGRNFLRKMAYRLLLRRSAGISNAFCLARAHISTSSKSKKQNTANKTVETFDYTTFVKDVVKAANPVKVIPGEPEPDRGAKALNLMESIRKIMNDNPDHIVLTEVGSFYEVRCIAGKDILCWMNINKSK